MLVRLIRTANDPMLAILRLVLGFVFFAHGAQKMLGWFGGPGFQGTMGMFAQMHIPSVFAFLAICAEFFGGLGLIVGFLGRVAAFGVLTNMVVAVVMVHAQQGLFMNWTGTKAGEGFEFHLLALAMSLVLLIRGSGAASVDLALSRSRRSQAFEIRNRVA